MRLEGLEQLVRQGETQEVEFKSAIPPPQDIAKQVAAFANTKGGMLILGVREPGEFVGVDEHRAREIIEMARQYLSPVPVMNVQSLQAHGHAVVVVQVPASDELHSAMGGYFGRGARPSEASPNNRQVRDSASETHRADAVRPLTPAEIRLHALKGRSDDTALSRLANAVTDQTRTIEKQTETIDKLSRDLAKANALWRKLVLALAGAIAGAILMYFMDQWWK